MLVSRIIVIIGVVWSLSLGVGIAAAQPPGRAGVVREEMIYDQSPFPECHASTVAETPQGLVVAWFGGTEEKHPDVGIWVSRHTRQGWSEPVEVANGIQNPTRRYPCWNPVLFQVPAGKLLLFFKVGPSPSTWWGEWLASSDDGVSWTDRRRLPDPIVGPIKNKPVLTSQGDLLCGSSTEDQGWRVHVERTTDMGQTWSRTEALEDGGSFGAIQPTLLAPGASQWRMLCRSRRGGKIVSAVSNDDGRTWSALEPLALPNPNSGIDGVTLSDGRHLLVYNHTQRGRSPLNVAISADAVHWRAAVVLEDQPGEYSYPAVIQTADGRVHVTYTWKRQRIKHVEIDPAAFKPRDFAADGQWPR